MIIGVDIDDVIYPWYDQAHKIMVERNVHNGVNPKSWYPYEEYGIERDAWRDILGEATIDGSLFLRGNPIAGATPDVFERIRTLGHEVHLVTSRGYLPHGKIAQAQTVIWLASMEYEYDHLTFTSDKGSVNLDYLVDDVVKNLIATQRNGTRGVLVNRSWNLEADAPLRVDSLADFVNILEATHV